MEVNELIAKSGRSKDDILNNCNDYCALKRKIDNPNSRHDDDNVWRMKDLHDVFLLGNSIHNRQNKINADCKVAAAAAATATAISNIANTSTSSYATLADLYASTSINVNDITASFESTPPSFGPSSTSSLPSHNDKTRASLDINSMSDQSSILASRSINEITASFEANASFALSTTRSNSSDSSIVCAQSLKRSQLASQQSDAVVDLTNKCSIWKPHQQLLSGNVSIIDVPGNGNCLFYACISRLQNCTTFTIKQESTMRNNLMDYLLLHADEPLGDSGVLIWRYLAMMHAPEIEDEMRHKAFFRHDPIVFTLDHYAHYMRIATENRCIYANTPELCLIACRYSLNIAVYQVDPRSSQQYVLVQEFVGDLMLPAAPLCPFFSLRFAHSLSILRVFFHFKVDHWKCSNNPFFTFR